MGCGGSFFDEELFALRNGSSAAIRVFDIVVANNHQPSAPSFCPQDTDTLGEFLNRRDSNCGRVANSTERSDGCYQCDMIRSWCRRCFRCRHLRCRFVALADRPDDIGNLLRPRRRPYPSGRCRVDLGGKVSWHLGVEGDGLD